MENSQAANSETNNDINEEIDNSIISELRREMENVSNMTQKKQAALVKESKKRSNKKKDPNGSSKVLKYRKLISAEEGSTEFNPSCRMFDEEQVLEDKKTEKLVGEFFKKLGALLIKEKQYKESRKIDDSYQSNFRCFLHYVHDKYSQKDVINYLDFDEYLKFHNDDSRDFWFCHPDIIRSFYEEVFPMLPTKGSNVNKMTYNLQRLINFELYDRTNKKFKACHYELNKDKEWKFIIKQAKEKHEAFQIDRQRASNLEIVDTHKLVKRDLSRKEFKKVISKWIESTKKLKHVDESKLEVIFVMAYDYKSLVRCASTKVFMFKSFTYIQEADDPPFIGLIVMDGEEKVTKNQEYASCAIRDVDPELCTQFQLAFMSIWKLETHGKKASFLDSGKIPHGHIHWSNMKLISATNANSISTKTKGNFIAAGVDPGKVTHMKSCGMHELTKKTDDRCNDHIFEENIKAVSRHDNNKNAYQRYLSWYQFPVFKHGGGHPHFIKYFLGREKNDLPLKICGNIVVIVAFVPWYSDYINQLTGPDGCTIDCSYQFLYVIIPYFIMVILQDAHHWIHNHKDHFFAQHILNCIHRIKDCEMRDILLEYIKDSPKRIMKIEREHKKELEKNNITEANIQRHMTNCTTKLEVQISNQGFAMQTMNNVAKKNSAKLDEVLMLQQQNLRYQKANYMINLENSKINYANSQKIDYIIKFIKDTNNSGNLEDLFNQMITSPVIDRDKLPKKIEDINRRLENFQYNQLEEDDYNENNRIKRGIAVDDSNESHAKSANVNREDFFATKAFGGRSNIEELNVTNEELNVARRLNVAEHANQTSTLAPSSDLGMTMFISNCINDPEREVTDWFSYQTYKMIDRAYAKNARPMYNTITKKKITYQ